MSASKQVNRPLQKYWWPQLQDLYKERYDDPIGLQEILSELLFRHRSGAVRLRKMVNERIVDLTFIWPSTDAPGGDGSLEGYNWPKEGMLSYLGYHVGQNGVRVESRRQILDLAYSGRLPNVQDVKYTASWGMPNSGKRLQKMAESIAAFCRNHKRRDPFAPAVLEWEQDLDYLKQKYYIGKYGFVWPKT